MENNELRTAARLSHTWQNLTPAKFCAQWEIGDWIEFISECDSKGLDPDAECMRLYEEQGDF